MRSVLLRFLFNSMIWSDALSEDKAQNTKLSCPYNIFNYMAGQM